jgi:hypothetical protein
MAVKFLVCVCALICCLQEKKPDRIVNIIEDSGDERTTTGASPVLIWLSFLPTFSLTTDFHFYVFLSRLSPPPQLVSHSSNEFRPSTTNKEKSYEKRKKKYGGGPPPNSSPVSDWLKAARNQVTWALFKWIGFLEKLKGTTRTGRDSSSFYQMCGD